ncbi:MAG: pyridoxal-phosphate-dependent aminotransferase family protein [Candidatus Methanodesulfokora sp.]
MALKYLTPGPVQIPKCVLDAVARQPQFHRTEEFRRIFKGVIEKLSRIGGTPVIIPGTGTLSVDIMVYNYINPGEKAVALVNGEFGKRLVDSMRSRGCLVHEIAWRHGDVPPPDVLEDFVSKIGDVRAIAVVHNETSNGTTNRFIERYQEIADSIGAVLLVDSVSAFPAEPIRSDVDVIATASQKAFISPPGAAILFISREPRAASGIPPSMDLRRFLKHIQKFETPYTPPINVIYGLDAALDYILNMGIERYHEIHRERANILYKRIKLEPIAREPFRSCTVTAFYTNRAEEIIDSLKARGYVIAGGMGELKGKAIRIGVMGEVEPKELEEVAEVVNRFVD